MTLRPRVASRPALPVPASPQEVQRAFASPERYATLTDAGEARGLATVIATTLIDPLYPPDAAVWMLPHSACSIAFGLPNPRCCLSVSHQ
jgi:hypothetical protein